jgi:ribonuclease P protein component
VNRKFRLTSSTDFKRVRRLGKSYAHPLVVLVTLPGGGCTPDERNLPLQNSHIGVTAGRSLGNAVQRNRAKRVLRAAFQPYLPAVLPGWDLILIARRPLLDSSFQQAQAAVLGLLRRAHLLQETHEA